MDIAILSGKGGTGKTLISTNLALAFEAFAENIALLDCDVEAPNSYLFIKPSKVAVEDISILAPDVFEQTKCNACGKCVDFCHFNALALIGGVVKLFPELCHACGGCTIICPTQAVIEQKRIIGKIKQGKNKHLKIVYGELKTGEGGMSPRLIAEVKNRKIQGYNILDAPAGTACPAVETAKDADYCLLIAEPTPFGFNDFKLMVEVVRKLKKKIAVIINKAEQRQDIVKNWCFKNKINIIGELPLDKKIAQLNADAKLLFRESFVYRKLFLQLAKDILAKGEKIFKHLEPLASLTEHQGIKNDDSFSSSKTMNQKMKKIAVVSGKGGTGKTSLTACLANVFSPLILVDGDVDGSDLHLIFKPQTLEGGPFIGGECAVIDQEKCQKCGRCQQECRFNSIISLKCGKALSINPLTCEGCGVCSLICPNQAITMNSTVNGYWYMSSMRTGYLAHAQLFPCEENSGKLVALNKDNGEKMAGFFQINEMIIDSSPGIGCPVIAALSGVDYALIVSEGTRAGFSDLKRIVDLIKTMRVKSGAIINKADISPLISGEMKLYLKNEQIDLVAELPYDDRITEAQRVQKTILEYDEKADISFGIKKVAQFLQQLLK